jgi:hypothetical protein
MTYLVIPQWIDPSGADTGPLATPCRDMPAVEREVGCWIRSHGRHPNLRVQVVDDLAWRTVVTVRPRRVQA